MSTALHGGAVVEQSVQPTDYSKLSLPNRGDNNPCNRSSRIGTGHVDFSFVDQMQLFDLVDPNIEAKDLEFAETEGLKRIRVQVELSPYACKREVLNFDELIKNLLSLSAIETGGRELNPLDLARPFMEINHIFEPATSAAAVGFRPFELIRRMQTCPRTNPWELVICAPLLKVSDSLRAIYEYIDFYERSQLVESRELSSSMLLLKDFLEEAKRRFINRQESAN